MAKRELGSFQKAIKITIISIFVGVPLILIFAGGILNYGFVNAYNQYWNRYDITGTITRASGRFTNADSSSIDFKPSFEIVDSEGKKILLNCDDTRCTTLEIGDKVTFNCYLQKQRMGSDEIECRYGVQK